MKLPRGVGRPRATAADVGARRLASQRLVGSGYASPAQVVSRMGAIQAQDYAAAKWALALRASQAVDDSHPTDAAIEGALAEGSILRTHVLRPTWHFVAPADIRWLLQLTAPRVRALMAHYDRKLGLTDAIYRKSNAAIARALRDRSLTRAELGAALARSGIDTTGSQRLGHLMMRAELDAVICSGPRQGKQFSYSLLDARAPEAVARSRDDALAELAARYFITRGPATIQDFAWWSGLSVADALRGAESAAGPVKRETIDGRVCWAGDDDASTDGAARAVHLLPPFDEYFVGYKDRSATLSEGPTEPVWAPRLSDNVIAIGGKAVGTWKRTITADAVRLTTDTARPLSAGETKRLEEQAARYGRFLGRRY